MEGLPRELISRFGESGIRGTRDRIHFDIRNPKILKGGRTEVMLKEVVWTMILAQRDKIS